MRLYLQGGSRHEALRQYESCRALIWDELAAEPEEETQALYREIGVGRAQPGSHPEVSPAPLPFALSQQPTGPFLGRQAAMGLFHEAVDRVQAGRGSAVFVSGEPGIGKSRLMKEAARHAAERGMLVLWGERAGVSHGYGTFVSAIESHLTALPPAEVACIARKHPDAALLLPSLSQNARTGTGERFAAAESRRYIVLLTEVLLDLARTPAVFLALDDLHAADASSLSLLRHRLRIVPRERLLIAGTYRLEDVPPGSALQEIVTGASLSDAGRTIGLMRLGRLEVDRLVESLLPDGSIPSGVFRHIYDRALGNPLFAESLVRNLRQEKSLVLRDGAWTLMPVEGVLVPPDVREIVDRRIHSMGEDARRIAALMAVSPGPSDFSLLQRAGSFSTSALLRGLDELLDGHIALEQQDGYGFFHPLYRGALHAGTSPRQRTHLHLALARALEEVHPGDADLLAHHYARTTEARKAATYLERAGDRARITYANEAAEDLYRACLERLSLLECREGALRVRAKLADVLVVAGRFDEAAATLEEVVNEHRRDGNLEGMAQAAASFGYLYRASGLLSDGLARVQPLADEVRAACAGSGPSRGVAALYMALARLLYGAFRFDESVALSEEARAIAAAIGNTGIELEAEVNWLSALSAARWKEAQEGFRIVIPLLEEAGDLESTLRAYLNLNSVSSLGGDSATRRSALERAVEISYRMGNKNYTAACLAELATMLVGLGGGPAVPRGGAGALRAVGGVVAGRVSAPVSGGAQYARGAPGRGALADRAVPGDGGAHRVRREHPTGAQAAGGAGPARRPAGGRGRPPGTAGRGILRPPERL
jgi:tetratricopeptide (TPR) repeat protein